MDALVSYSDFCLALEALGDAPNGIKYRPDLEYAAWISADCPLERPRWSRVGCFGEMPVGHRKALQWGLRKIIANRAKAPKVWSCCFSTS